MARDDMKRLICSGFRMKLIADIHRGQREKVMEAIENLAKVVSEGKSDAGIIWDLIEIPPLDFDADPAPVQKGGKRGRN
ncbi:MAG: hypothetical protein IKE64_11230 [Thermoguttaceae bacterium]|nr:hypothetical protein [Thermoguttaceae bacterium]